jgi:hypothetical protein
MVPRVDANQHRTMPITLPKIAFIAALAAGSMSGAHADPLAEAKLVRCAAGNCLLIRGERASAASTVTINDRVVAVQGRRGWKVRLPVSAVRTLASPFARSLQVAVIDPAGAVEQQHAVRLPVGLLGHTTELASLVVRAR